MQVGVFYFPVDYGIDPGELAAALEARGFASLYVPEHTHIPTSRRTPFPSGGEMPKKYAHMYDPFVTLSKIPDLGREEILHLLNQYAPLAAA